MRYEEKCICTIFIFLVLFWFFRNPKFIPGWDQFFQEGYVTDGTAAMGISILMFVIPGENPLEKLKDGTPYRPLLTWKHMSEKFNWGTVILLGGGYAMAAGVQSSGLSDFISSKLANINNLPEWIFLGISCIMVTFLTEFSSNVATASIFIPMVQSIALEHKVNPLYYMIPVTLSSSFAFMFPAAPPNAIVFGTKMLTISDMVMTLELTIMFMKMMSSKETSFFIITIISKKHFMKSRKISFRAKYNHYFISCFSIYNLFLLF